MVSHGPCTSMTSMSSDTTVGGSASGSRSSGSTGVAPGCFFSQSAASRATLPSSKTSTESSRVISRDHARAIANDACAKSRTSSAIKTSNSFPSACVSRIGALRTRIPSALLRIQYVESPAARRNSAAGGLLSATRSTHANATNATASSSAMLRCGPRLLFRFKLCLGLPDERTYTFDKSIDFIFGCVTRTSGTHQSLLGQPQTARDCCRVEITV